MCRDNRRILSGLLILYWRLLHLHENRAGTSNIPRIYIRTSCLLTIAVKKAEENPPRRGAPADPPNSDVHRIFQSLLGLLISPWGLASRGLIYACPRPEFDRK